VNNYLASSMHFVSSLLLTSDFKVVSHSAFNIVYNFSVVNLSFRSVNVYFFNSQSFSHSLLIMSNFSEGVHRFIISMIGSLLQAY
jgi:hypothetical protein